MREPESDRAQGSALTPSRRALSRLQVGLIVVTGVLAITAVAMSANKDEVSAPSGHDDIDSMSVRQDELVSRLLELQRLSLTAVRERDLSMLSSIYTSDSPMSRQAAEVIRKQLADGVQERTSVDVLRTVVVEPGAHEASLQQTVLTKPCVVTDSGDDITEGPGVIRQRITWIIRRETGTWKIHNALIDDEQVIDDHHVRCN